MVRLLVEITVVQVAADDLHQSGLARAVGADEAVAVAIAELDADVLEQGLGAELDGEVVGGDHGGGGKKWSQNNLLV